MMKKQGVWGEQSTHVDPKDMDMARNISSAPNASKASEINDEFVTTSKKGSVELEIKDLDEYKTFLEERNQTHERTSPTFALTNLLVQAPAYDLQRYQDSDGAPHSEVWLH